MCNPCRVNEHSLQEMRQHLKICPKGKKPDLTCGHCRFSTNRWSSMCAHLNQPGMQHEKPCGPEFQSAKIPPFQLNPPSSLPATPLPVSRDVPVSGTLVMGSFGSPRGKTARLKRGFHESIHAPSASLAAPCTIRYDTRCYFNVRWKADISQLNLPHGNDN